jgi:hypothetical protein
LPQTAGYQAGSNAASKHKTKGHFHRLKEKERQSYEFGILHGYDRDRDEPKTR